MKFVANKTVTRNGKVLITKGDVLTEKQVEKKKVKSYVVPQVINRVKWTKKEVETICRLYHDMSPAGEVNHRDITDSFIEYCPDTHNRAGVMMMINQIRSLDSLAGVGGLESVSPYLAETLTDIDPERYS